jgi:7,8-dihydropterin-6-yl-methyl-4-(beta-D-ribofuranosyl)aminobenzene 5'-phosphate synthase
MKIVTLMENTRCREDLCCEHGLSLHIETENHRILFDAGQSVAFAENAEKLNVDLKHVDFAVLSHGHYDHGGGLGKFLEVNEQALVYVSSYAFEPHYSQNGYIGLEPALRDSGRMIPVSETTELAEGITLYRLDCEPMDTAGLEMEEAGVRKPDDFRHEQYLLLEEAGKRILISGCSHKGILNIMEAFRPDILVGGFHFMKITDEAWLKAAAETLLSYDTVYYTGHCTGQTQYDYLKSIMGDRLHYLSTGSVVEI